MRIKFHSSKRLAALAVLLAATACGQDPSFLDVEHSQDSESMMGDSRSADSTSDEDKIDNFGNDDTDNQGVLGDVIGDGPSDTTATNTDDDGGGSNNGGNPSIPTTPIDPDDVEVPGTNETELGAIRRCMAKWNQFPFPRTVTNFRKMVSVTVGGFGNAINDTEVSEEPKLVLIVAGVNVGGAPTYNLMNPNAWYCMMVNVNVSTDFTINLHCNARLADSLVDVNVGSTMTGSTARIGVHVNSEVTINTVRPNGEECLR